MVWRSSCVKASLILFIVFDLPPELLATLQLKDPTFHEPDSTTSDSLIIKEDSAEVYQDTQSERQDTTSCLLCQTAFANFQHQRDHAKSDWHKYNLKQKVRGAQTVSEPGFEKLIDELDESISGSGSESSKSDSEDVAGVGRETTLTALLRRQAKMKLSDEEAGDVMPKKPKRGAGKPPLIWFSSALVPSNVSLGIYRALFTAHEQGISDIVNVIREKQLRAVPAKLVVTDRSNGVPLPSEMTSPSIFMCMIGGGHFAGMIVSLAPKLGKQASGSDSRQAIVLAHKTFHRYTTRRKQGGAQSANDSAKGAAHSAGSSLRRYNEVALEQEIRALLTEWRELINNTQLIFVRATGSSNRRIIFGPYEGQVLHHNDPRNRTFPFSTRRATQNELMRAFKELTSVKVSEVDEAAIAAAAEKAEADSKLGQAASRNKAVAPSKPQPSKEEEESLLHTSQIQALIRRSKAPALLSYLSSNHLSANFDFRPHEAQANYHAPTPLHLASSTNSSAVVLALMTKVDADPTFPNREGRPSFDLAGDRVTRDAFRVARSELGEEKWDWDAAHVPPALSKEEAEKRDTREKAESAKAEAERRKAEEERLRKQTPRENGAIKKGGKPLGSTPKTAEEKREEEARGLTPEMKAKVERERRARAAEERMKRMTGR